MKFKTNPTENLERHKNESRSRNYFSRNKYQLGSLARFTKHINGEEQVFHKWIKSEIHYNYSNEYYSIQNGFQKIKDSNFKK